MTTNCEIIPKPQGGAAGAKRNRGLAARDRSRSGAARWRSGTATVPHIGRAVPRRTRITAVRHRVDCGTGRAPPADCGTGRAAPRWTAGLAGGNSVPHVGCAAPLQSQNRGRSRAQVLRNRGGRARWFCGTVAVAHTGCAGPWLPSSRKKIKNIPFLSLFCVYIHML